MDPLTMFFTAAASGLGSSLFSGNNTASNTSGWTKTPSKEVTTLERGLDEDTITAMLKTLLEDPSSGLAKTSMTGKIPGLYGSTTQGLLTNDLMARIATNVAKEAAPVTTTRKFSDYEMTQSNNTEQAGGGGGLLGGLLGGCYITTACCKLYDKPDDCHELQTMRKFRDEFVRVKYPEAVADYYATAPAIVHAIEAREDADDIWARFYAEYIIPAVAAAESGDYEKAYEVYTDMVIEAEVLANA